MKQEDDDKVDEGGVDGGFESLIQNAIDGGLGEWIHPVIHPLVGGSVGTSIQSRHFPSATPSGPHLLVTTSSGGGYLK